MSALRRNSYTFREGLTMMAARAAGIDPDLAVEAGDKANSAMNFIRNAMKAKSPKARAEHVTQAQQALRSISPSKYPQLVNALQAKLLALQGRGGDTEIAHVTPGEVVVARNLQTPAVMRTLAAEARRTGIDPRRYTVGHRANSVNPGTGKPEFGCFYGDPGECFVPGIGNASRGGIGSATKPPPLPTSWSTKGSGSYNFRPYPTSYNRAPDSNISGSTGGFYFGGAGPSLGGGGGGSDGNDDAGNGNPDPCRDDPEMCIDVPDKGYFRQCTPELQAIIAHNETKVMPVLKLRIDQLKKKIGNLYSTLENAQVYSPEILESIEKRVNDELASLEPELMELNKRYGAIFVQLQAAKQTCEQNV